MGLIRISNLLEIRKYDPNSDNPEPPAWEPYLLFQNGNTRANVEYDNKSWSYLSFLYQGATRNRTGDNIEAGIVLSTNIISMQYAQQVVEKKLLIVVYTCLMNEHFTRVSKLINKEQWVGTTMSYDTETVEVQLASRIDAVGFSIPNMFLKKSLVGELPTTGSIRIS